VLLRKKTKASTSEENTTTLHIDTLTLPSTTKWEGEVTMYFKDYYVG